MTEGPLHAKLDPQRFPNMSLPMAAILGFVLERQYTTPALADVQVTPDGHVLGWPSEEECVGHSMHLGVEADLRANLSRLGMAAGLDQQEWTLFAAMVRSQLGIELGELAGKGGS
ncbi:hypothetical protein Thimo_3776 (plasmid) [Thioflavicoccus mobilis 8321]|uniref:Uncharacterized protein n=1 Tax=Thioflavicoccus mobilis 8321 TaxID=765912 RepID=L0H085_9GAMM|nr:hypothetical protein [Thioflavicoccus mobilis]AGA92428.1 hypothetical protein Thimo_3776 [Thioflavicoccus mobilis 8321]